MNRGEEAFKGSFCCAIRQNFSQMIPGQKDQSSVMLEINPISTSSLTFTRSFHLNCTFHVKTETPATINSKQLLSFPEQSNSRPLYQLLILFSNLLIRFVGLFQQVLVWTSFPKFSMGPTNIWYPESSPVSWEGAGWHYFFCTIAAKTILQRERSPWFQPVIGQHLSMNIPLRI